ncbi:MAG: AAA family ATPase [Oligoflexia bacterium]|nr:AAA family ATPase [Oligoflexia bacterium]
MARVQGKDINYEVAKIWMERCLIEEKSFFWGVEKVFSYENLKRLENGFVQNGIPGRGDDSALGKLEEQFKNLPKECLMALCDLYGFLSIFNSKSKRETILENLAKAAAIKNLKIPKEHDFCKILNGIGGSGFLIQQKKYWATTPLIVCLLHLKKNKGEITADNIKKYFRYTQDSPETPEDTKSLLGGVMNITLHLLFPDTFERVAIHGHKINIAQAFQSKINQDNIPDDIDEKLLLIRQYLEKDKGMKFTDFFQEEVRKLWYKEKGKKKKKDVDSDDDIDIDDADVSDSNEILFKKIENALTRRGQVILYGPPGTGKTYIALQYIKNRIAADFDSNDDNKKQDRKNTSDNIKKVNIIAVANHQKWDWLKYDPGHIEDWDGRLGCGNPSKVVTGSLVFGYRTKDIKGKKAEGIFALGEVKENLSTPVNGKRKTKIKTLCILKNPVSLQEISRKIEEEGVVELKKTLQGTYFILTEEQANCILGLVVERNPDLPDNILDLFSRNVSDGFINQNTENSDRDYYEFVSFHPSYTFEDFVEGLRPVETKNGNGVTFKPTAGPLKRMCERAIKEDNKKFYLLIDEINRAHTPRVLGPMISMIEKDKRISVRNGNENEHAIRMHLPTARNYSAEVDPEWLDGFGIPENIHIIGTMNTADRSTMTLDVAIRRRFAFIPFLPDSDVFEEYGENGDIIESCKQILDGFNKYFKKESQYERQLGHGVFMCNDGKLPDTYQELCDLISTEILPLIQDVFWENPLILKTIIRNKNCWIDMEAQPFIRNTAIEAPGINVEFVAKEQIEKLMKSLAENE